MNGPIQIPLNGVAADSNWEREMSGHDGKLETD